ncbi:MAG TPA: ATP synthase F0 subunit B [Polyangia bacterium]
MSRLRVLRLFATGVAIAIVLGATSAWAAGGGSDHGAHLDLGRLGLQLLNFGVLLAILGFFAGKAINRALAARHEQMKKDLDEANAARVSAQARLVEHEARLKNIEGEVAALLASIKDEAAKEEALLLANAEERSRRIQAETQFLVDQQVKEAQVNFRKEVAEATARIAEVIVRRAVRPEDETRLQQTFVMDVQTGKEANH